MTLAYQEFYTANDYSQWEGEWELIGGMPYAMSPSPTVSHQAVATNITSEVKNTINSTKEDNCLGCIVLMETDWQISLDTVVRPDVMLVCKAVDEKVLVTPDLIIEVVSSSSIKRDEVMKFDLYQREGVKYYILAYPENRLAKVYLNINGGYQKVGDFSKDSIEFTLDSCVFPIDFSAIWRN